MLGNVVGINSQVYVEQLTSRMYNMIVEAYEILKQEMLATTSRDMPTSLSIVQHDIEELEILLAEFEELKDKDFIPLQYHKKFFAVEKVLTKWEEGKRDVEEARRKTLRVLSEASERKCKGS